MKTKKEIFVPLIPRSLEILKKYSFNLPEIPYHILNRYIKDACAEAEINRPVERTESSGSRKVAMKVPKTVAQITGKTVNVILNHYYGTDKHTILREMEKGFGKAVQMKVS